MRLLATVTLVCSSFAASAYAAYETSPDTCGGLPKVQVGTIDGTCLGLVIQKGPGAPLKKPRKIAQVAGRDAYLLTDMGGWNPNLGTLYLIERNQAGYAIRQLKSKLNLPHQIIAGPDGRYYLGEAHRIVAFGVNAENEVENWRTVVADLPDVGDNLHPLTHFIFMENRDLLVNIGAATDACRGELAAGVCAGRENHGLLRLYRYLPDSGGWDPDFEIYARGLRNSMALVRHPSGAILQAENGADFKAAGEPYEEINVVERGADYGWPYCYDNDAADPDWNSPGRCRGESYRSPWTLMPPHAAPLDMIYYTGDLLPGLRNHLIVGWHGYRQFGQRLVAYEVDARGRPLRSDHAGIRSSPTKSNPDFAEQAYAPDGSRGPVARHIELVSAWNKTPGVRPRGAPVGLMQADDGSLWVVDDRNKAVLRFTRGEPWRAAGAVAAAHAPVYREDPDYAGVVLPVLQRRCQACHEFLKGVEAGKVAGAFGREGWLDAPLSDSKLAAVMAAGAMPPQEKLPATEAALIEDWLGGLRVE